MKKFLAMLILTCLVINSIAAPIYAAPTSTTTSQIKVIIDGKEMKFKYQPIVSGSQIYLYQNDLLAYYGYDKTMHGTICYRGNDKGKVYESYEFVPDFDKVQYFNYITYEANDYKLGTLIVHDKSFNYYIPLSFITKVMGGSYTFNKATKVLSIKSNRKTSFDTAPIPAPEHNSNIVFDGFTIYEADGFRLQVPKDWEKLSSRLLYDKSELYSLIFEENNSTSYRTTIQIRKYDKGKDYEAYAKDLMSTTPLSFEKVTITGSLEKVDISNADAAYSYRVSDNDVKSPYFYTIVAFKGDLAYIFRSSEDTGMDFNPMFTGQVFIDDAIRRINKYRSDVEKMASTFELKKDSMTLEQITSSTASSMAFSEIKANLLPYDEMGNIIKKGDTVKRMGFFGKVLDINGAQVQVYWSSKAPKMTDKYISYWSSIGDVEYQKTQWLDAKRVRIDGRGY